MLLLVKTVSSFQLLAVELGLVSTKMTKADKAEHIKRQRRSLPQAAASMQIKTQTSNIQPTDSFVIFRPYFVCLAPGVSAVGLGFKVQSLTTDDHRLAKMAKQVKDVLPHVPLNIITKDLGRSPLLLCKKKKKVSVLVIFDSCLQQKPTVLTPP